MRKTKEHGASFVRGGSPAPAAQTPPAVPRPSSALRWLPPAIVLIGSLLRIAYTAGNDVRNLYDDHFHVSRIMLDERRWPLPQDGWETYQPPLYHALGALTYYIVSGYSTVHLQEPTPQEKYLPQGVVCHDARHLAGRKAVQFLSTASGVGTLVLVWLLLRLLFPHAVLAQSAGLLLAAFLPRHIYMSGMATNDAMTYLWASLCVYALLRAVHRATGGDSAPAVPSRSAPAAGDSRRPHATPKGARLPSEASTTAFAPAAAAPARGWSSYGWWVLAGCGAALAMWTKQYGICVLPVLATVIPMSLFARTARARGALVRGALVSLGVALALGAWPYVRLYRLTGNPMASNVPIGKHVLDEGLPGDVRAISWVSFHLGSLLARPWIHISTVNSFWTVMYGELWFDYAMPCTVYTYAPWLESLGRGRATQPRTPREYEQRMFSWDPSVVPPVTLWQGRFIYTLAVLPTALTIVGLFTVWRRTGPVVGSAALMACFLLGVLTPLAQTIRFPYRPSMKATYGLHALIAAIVLFVAGFEWLSATRHGRWLRWIVVLDLVLLAGAVTWHFLYLADVFPYSAEYFVRRGAI